MTPFLGPILARFSVQFSAHFGLPGPGLAGTRIFRIFRISGISGFPARPGPSPGTPLPGGVAGGSPGRVLYGHIITHRKLDSCCRSSP